MASNIVEILIGAKDDAKLDLDSLKARLDELAHKVAEAKVSVKGDKEAELALDRLGSKLITLGKRTASPKITLEGAFKAATEITALDLALGHLEKKTNESSGGGLFSSMARGLNGLVSGLGNLAGAGSAIINPITIALAGLALVISGPLLASLAPITLGFAAFGAGAVGEIKKVITAHQQLQAAQAAYEKATTSAGKASALRAEKLATEDLSGSEKGLLGMIGQLGQMFHKLQAAVQPQVIKSFASVLKIIKDLMPTLIPLAVAAGKAIAGFLNHIDKWLQSDSGKKFLHWMQVDGPNAIRRFGNVMWDTVRFIGQAFDFLRNAGDTWWQNVHSVISHVMHAWDSLVSFIRGIAHALAGDWSSMVSQARAIWSGIYNVLVAPIERAYSVISGIIGNIRGAISSLNGALGGLPGKALGLLGHFGLAAGGIAGAASGGLRSNLTLVGERGPELVQMSAGSRVYNNNQTRQMMSGASGGAGNSYSISVSVAPGGHPAETGRQIVNAIREFERGSGKSWRS